MKTPAVALSDGGGEIAEYGPFTSQEEAESFAAFLTAEVNPARVIWVDQERAAFLRSPVPVLLHWYGRFGGGK